MSAAAAVPRARASVAVVGGGTERAVARRAFALVWKGATVCAVGFSAMVASTAAAYVGTFPTEAGRQELAAATSGDLGLAVLLGPITSIETVGGYTVYKLYVTLTSVGAIWALLAATRLLRGQEDAGRWQLLLAGATRAGRATAATLVALGTAVAMLCIGATAGALLAGADPAVGFGPGESVLYGLSLTIAPAVFVGVGAVTSQLARTRRLATGLGMAVFGLAFVLRMAGDSGPGARWLLWLTPFGWTELMVPFTGNDARPLVPAAVTVAALCVAAIVLAGRRDVGDGMIATRDVAAARPFGLGSAFGLASRLEGPVLVAWWVGTAAAALLLGMMAKLITESVPASIGDTLAKFAVQGSLVEQFFGVASLMLATVVALLPAGQIGAMCDEETSGRLVHVLTRPTSRAVWLGGRLALAGAAVLVAGMISGLAAWLGATSQGVPIGLGTLVVLGLNVVPTALVALGLGAVLLSVAPRAAAAAVYGVVIWSLSVDLLGSMVSGLSQLEALSLFHFMALAPAEDPDPFTLAATVAVAAGLCALAVVVFARRDLRSV